MAIEYRTADPDTLRAAWDATHVAFGEEAREDDFERERQVMPPDRVLNAYDNGRAVATTAAYPFTMTIPGGELPAGGVTWVGVAPSHRRRGVASELMRRQLHDLNERGEPIAILWASESAIYGRFGYGIAAPNVELEADRARFRLRDDPEPVGAVRLVDQEEAAQAFPEIYERIRPARAGMLSRTPDWWAHHRLLDVEHIRRGAGPKFYALFEVDGRPEAYAMYRLKSDWERGLPKGELWIIEAMATSPAATRELWRFLFGVDLVTRVKAFIFDPASPLFLMVVDPRALHMSIGDGLWLRFVDLERSLAARSYEASDPVVLEIRDQLCPWNAGRWRIDGGVERTDAGAEVALDVADLASVYLGAFNFERLAEAGRVEELTPGAVARASALFRTPRTPFCPEVF